MKATSRILIVLWLITLSQLSISQKEDNTSVLLIYTFPQEMKVIIKGDEFKLSEKKKESEMVVKNVPSGLYEYKFINSYRNLKGSFMVPANDTLAILANIENFSHSPVSYATMDEIREEKRRIKREKEIQDSLMLTKKTDLLEGAIHNENSLDEGIYEPSDEEILAKSDNPDSVYVDEYDTFFYIVEEMPTFNQGDPAVEFREYIARHITFPEGDCILQVKKKLTVVSSFIVGSDGYIRDIEIITPNVPKCIQETVIDLLYSSPRWMPGFQRGRPVNVRVNFPVTFIPPQIG